MPTPKLYMELNRVYNLGSTAKQAQIIWSQEADRETDIETIGEARISKEEGVLSTRKTRRISS